MAARMILVGPRHQCQESLEPEKKQPPSTYHRYKKRLQEQLHVSTTEEKTVYYWASYEKHYSVCGAGITDDTSNYV